ncbi:MAG: hypothetical protein ACNYPD_00990 [Candidatus Halichondribacter symbioticus]
MTYIKLLTALAGLALLTACGGGGAATPTPDNNGGDGNAADCTTNAFHADCDANAPAIITLRQSQCLADTDIDPSCIGETGIATVFCKASPFDTSNACVADTGAIVLRQTMCLANIQINDSCRGDDGIATVFCKNDPFHDSNACKADIYFSNRIAECIKAENTGDTRCDIIAPDTAINTAITTCIDNPFGDTCGQDNTTFTPYSDTAKMNRARFCDDNANVANTLCTNTNLMNVCEFDPFTAICPDNTYATPRQEACLMDITTNPACMGEMGIATVFCKANPFDTSNACMAGTYLPDRIADCIADGNGDDPKCPLLFTATASKACLTNPFTDACKTDGDFGTYADMARMNRISFCETMGNETDTLCMNTNLMNLCVFNPFSTACTGVENTPDLQVASCRDDGNDNKHSTCGEVLLAKENDLPAYPALPVATTRRGFLEGIETGINTTVTGFTTLTSGSGKFDATATAGTGEDMVSLGGATTDGVEWAEIRIDDGTTLNYYAGIFSGTDMGAVLVKPAIGTKAKVDWKGIIQGNNTLTTITSPTPFTLNVDLFNRTLKTYIIINNSQAFTIDGIYDAKGLISGTVLRGAYEDTADPTTFKEKNTAGTQLNPDNHYGTLTGLIGAKGAVGAFHSDGTTQGYSGGFIANYTAPPPPNPCIALGTCVDTADWLAGVTPTPLDLPDGANRKSQFLKGTSTGFADRANLNIREALGIQTDDIDIETIEFAHADIAAGGAAFFGGELYVGTKIPRDQYYYAGILAGTNLGAPITETITTAVRWTGKILSNSNTSSGRFDKNEIGTFGVNITFDGDDGGTIKEFFQADSSSYFLIDGTFDANGIITGKVELGNKLGNTGTINTTTNLYSPGTLSGIIGQDGAVGAFHSGHTTLRAHADNTDRYSGGFIATPPPPPSDN